MRIAWLALTLALGCRGAAGEGDAPEDTDATSPVAFDTPWEAAAPASGTVDGWLLAELDSALPGAGWFDAPGAKGHDVVFASVQPVDGATWPVVQLRISGHVKAGWHVLELDVALNHWVAGEVPVDGEAAVGVLTEADGRVRYVVGGTLEVLSAGVSAGDRVPSTGTSSRTARRPRARRGST